MTDEKWNIFASTGKIEDYLEYKNAYDSLHVKDGDINGNSDAQGYSFKGISGR